MRRPLVTFKLCALLLISLACSPTTPASPTPVPEVPTPDAKVPDAAPEQPTPPELVTQVTLRVVDLSGVAVALTSLRGPTGPLESYEDGSYVLEVGQLYQLEAPGLLPMEVLEDGSRATLELTAWPPSSVAGVARVGPAGPPLAGASVQLGEHSTTSDAQGRFMFEGLRPGRHYVIVDSGAHHGVGVAALGLAQQLEGLEIATWARVKVDVRVVSDKTGKPSPSCRLRLVQNDDGAAYLHYECGKQGLECFSLDARGRGSLWVDPHELYGVELRCSDHLDARPPNFEVEDRNTSKTWRVDPGLTHRGTVVDEHGTPLAGVGVDALREHSDNPAMVSATTDRKGEFVLRGLHPAAYTIGVVYGGTRDIDLSGKPKPEPTPLVLSRESYEELQAADAAREASPPPSLHVESRRHESKPHSPNATLRGIILDTKGEPLAGAIVGWTPTGIEGALLTLPVGHGVRSDKQGRFELAVELRESRGCDADPLPASCEATLVALLPGGGAGALTLTQDMSRDALELHVGDFASVEISGQLEGREQHHLNIDGVEFYLPTGRVTVPGFFAGRLRIWVSRRGNFMGYLGQTDVRAVAGQTVEAKVEVVDE